MHWVLSNNITHDSAFPTLIDQIVRQGGKYTMVGTIPFSGEVVSVDGDAPLEDIRGPVFCCGKGSMKHLARRFEYRPGYIEAFDILSCMRYIKSDMLNGDAVTGPLGFMTMEEDRMFVRPNADDKSFSGQVMNRAEFDDWKKSVLSLNDDNATIQRSDIIVMSPLKAIHAEYRFYVVSGEVVTGSLYKVGNTVTYAECIDRSIINYAQRVADKLPRTASYVLDVADTPDGLRILETNSISSSGFYAIDIGKFVAAINTLAME